LQAFSPSPKDASATLIKEYDERFLSRFGYAAPPLDEGTLIGFAYDELEDPNKVGDAIELFKMAVKYYPGSSNAFDSLGDGYAKAGNRSLAIDAYRHAIELHSSDYTDVSKSKLDALTSTKK
jgi:tetratricopeptide (TPR) repeat protein